MGLYSDYLERNRERTNNYEIDPCMVYNGGAKNGTKYYTELSNQLKEYISEKDEIRKQELRQQIIIKRSEIETIKTSYLVGEKLVLNIKNSYKFRSTFVDNKIQNLLHFLEESYQSSCNLCANINQCLTEKINVEFNAPAESDIKSNLLYLLTISMLKDLNDKSAEIDSSIFRKIVIDFAELIKYFKGEKSNLPSKKIVSDYLAQEIGYKYGKTRCINCDKYLFKDIPFCLNCYERNQA